MSKSEITVSSFATSTFQYTIAGVVGHYGGQYLAPHLDKLGAKAVERIQRTLVLTKGRGGYVNFGASIGGKSAEEISWTNHGGKHVVNDRIPWKNVVSSTKTGPAKYLPEVNVEKIEREIWEKGLKVTNGRDWKVLEFTHDIGASGGRMSSWIRVEKSANTIHGHPITKEEFLKLTR